MKGVLLAVAASIITAIYWWAVFLAVYANVLFAGDRSPSASSASDQAQIGYAALVIIGGVIGYTVLILLWRRLTRSRSL